MSDPKKQALTESISYEKMRELNDNFKKKKKKDLARGIGKEETNAIWFEKNADLQTFFLRILGDPDISGVRVYLCDYPSVAKDGIPKKEGYVKQMTVAFVPTEKIGNLHIDLPVEKKEDDFFILAGGALNNGSLCPPDPGCN